jgi:lysophospholipase L1-like esterase
MGATVGRGGRWWRAAASTFAIVAVSVVLLVGADRLLGLLGYPPAVPIQLTHPPNFKEVRETAEFRYTFATNSRGLRYAEIPVEKEPGEFRILLLGDSFTEGDGVELDQTFGSVLEHAYQQRRTEPKVRLINGGLSGKGPLEYWRLFLHVGLAYRPDLLLIVVMANDVENMSENFSPEDLSRIYERGEKKGVKRLAHALLPHAYTILERARRLAYVRAERERPVLDRILEEARRRGIPEDRIAAWEASLLAEIRRDAGRLNEGRVSRGLLNSDFLVNNLDIATPVAETKLRAMITALDKIIELANARGIRSGVIFAPFDYQYDPRRLELWDPWVATGMKINKRWPVSDSVLQIRLAEWVRARSLPMLDLTPVFRVAVSRVPAHHLNYRLDGHWTAAGHVVAAQAIGRWLDETKLIPSTFVGSYDFELAKDAGRWDRKVEVQPQVHSATF